MRSINVLLAAAAVTAVAAPAVAQSRSSFLDVTSTSGIIVTPLGLDEFQVALANGAAFSFGGNSYAITDLIGFWALSNDDNLAGSTSDFGDWRANASNTGTGGILGWKSRNANSGLTLGQSVVFKFDSFKPEQVEQWGFHVRLNGTFPGTNGNTGFITVPGPASLGALGLALVVVPSRRRRS